MNLRLWRSLNLMPGVRLNFFTRGPSISFGARGAWVTLGRRGVRSTVGLPGTGLYLTEHRRYGQRPTRWGQVLFWAAVGLAAAALVHNL